MSTPPLFIFFIYFFVLVYCYKPAQTDAPKPKVVFLCYAKVENTTGMLLIEGDQVYV